MDPNEKLTGITSMAPPGMGGPPPGPPMGGPPMGGPPPGMGGGQPPMPEQGMGEMAMEGQPPMEEGAPDPQQDAVMLAEAVVDRAGGDINAAIGLIDNTKDMLIQAASAGGQEPQMMMGGGPLYAQMGMPMYREDGGELNPGLQALQKTNPEVVNQILKREDGGPMYANMGMPMYANEGRSLSDSDMLRQMIMENLQKPDIQEQMMSEAVGQLQGQSGRSMSDKDSMMLSDAEKFSNLLKGMS